MGMNIVYESTFELTECALNTDGELTISGKRWCKRGKKVDSSRLLNQLLVFGKLSNQSPPNLYFPELYSFCSRPSPFAKAKTSAASSGGKSGAFSVTLIRSNGKPKSCAKSSGGVAPTN